VRKIQLVNEGRVTCREIVSPVVRPIIDPFLKLVEPQAKDRMHVGEVKAASDLPDPINFCIFQRQLDNYDDAQLFIGWVSDPGRLIIQHTSIVTDNPALVRLFSAYFGILEHAVKPSDAAAGTLP
jgi:hypothetical protein